MHYALGLIGFFFRRHRNGLFLMREQARNWFFIFQFPANQIPPENKPL
jgi:hypothetical protein